MTVLFPDIEPLLVEFLDGALAASNLPVAQNVRVGTLKLPAGDEAPREVVITAAYNATLTDVTRAATATIDIWAENYADASNLALLVGALIVNVPRDTIKRAIVSLGPVRLSEDGPSEHRVLSVDFTVKGEDL